MFQLLLNERKSNPGGLDAFFATHPLEESRIASTQAQIATYPASQLQRLTKDTPAFQTFRRRLMALPPAPKSDDRRGSFPRSLLLNARLPAASIAQQFWNVLAVIEGPQVDSQFAGHSQARLQPGAALATGRVGVSSVGPCSGRSLTRACRSPDIAAFRTS
jgi:hypothetical protein